MKNKQTQLVEAKDDNTAPVLSNSEDIQSEILTVLKTDNLSSEEKAQMIAGILKVEQYSGPIPPPQFLESYQSLIPDAPERFLRMVEEEHNASIEKMRSDTEVVKELANAQKTKVKNAHIANLLSQTLAFVLVILFTISGVYLTATDHDTIGGIIFGTTIVGVTSLFITGALKKQKQGQEQQEDQE